MRLQAGQWDAAEREAAACGASYSKVSDVVAALKCRNLQAEALWRGGQAAAAVALWQETATTLQQRGDEAGARAVRLRLADAQAGSGQAEDIEAARQAVLAELPALHDRDALATAEFALAARLAAWRVLDRAGDPAAAGQLALAASWRWRRPNWSRFWAPSATPKSASGCATPCPGTATWSRRSRYRTQPLEDRRAAGLSGAPACRRLGPGVGRVLDESTMTPPPAGHY
jgi:hypothetical protein